MQLPPSTILLHYRLVEKLGEAGMGVAWRATDTTLERNVAIKLLPDVFANDPDPAPRFERESKVLASLSRPHITTVHSVHQVDGLHFLPLELAHGENLDARRKAFDGETVIDLLRRCLEKDATRRLRDAGEARILIGCLIANPRADAGAAHDEGREIARGAPVVARRSAGDRGDRPARDPRPRSPALDCRAMVGEC